MPKKEPPLTVVLEPVFVRDHQRRLRLVIDLLEQVTHRQYIPPTNSQSPPETLRAFTATQHSTGGHR